MIDQISALTFELVQDKPTDNLGLGSLAKRAGGSKAEQNQDALKRMASKVYVNLEKAVSNIL